VNARGAAPARPRGAWRGGVDAQGWLRGARRVASPNADERPPGVAVDLLVIHHVSLPPGRFSGDAVERLFTNRLDPRAHPSFASLDGVRVSAHFLVRRRGEVVQFVSGERRAWHAGASSFLGRERCNDFSIGVELEGDGAHRFTEPQYRALGELAAVLARRWPLRHVAGHSDIAPGRKTDPGPCFDWLRVERMLRPSGLARPFGRQSRADARSA
jgi:AmpD protein